MAYPARRKQLTVTSSIYQHWGKKVLRERWKNNKSTSVADPYMFSDLKSTKENTHAQFLWISRIYEQDANVSSVVTLALRPSVWQPTRLIYKNSFSTTIWSTTKKSSKCVQDFRLDQSTNSKTVNLLADRFDVVCRIAAEAKLPDIRFLQGAPRTTLLPLKDFSMRLNIHQYVPNTRKWLRVLRRCAVALFLHESPLCRLSSECKSEASVRSDICWMKWWWRLLVI